MPATKSRDPDAGSLGFSDQTFLSHCQLKYPNLVVLDNIAAVLLLSSIYALLPRVFKWEQRHEMANLMRCPYIPKADNEDYGIAWSQRKERAHLRSWLNSILVQ